MTARKPISWFLTEKGRSFSFGLLTSAGLVFTTVKFVPHTILLFKYHEFVQYYQNSKPVPVSDELLQRFNKCMDILKIPERQKKVITPFRVYGYDLFHAGCSKYSRYGSIIGIPVNFTYKSVEDVHKDDVQVNLQKVDWSSEAGEKLADALILPEKVQEFALCREILATQTSKIYFDSAFPFFACFMAYNLSRFVNMRFNLYKSPTVVRSTLYVLTGLFSLGTYFLMKDYTEVHFETEIDKKLVEVDPSFVECGVIFYKKLMQRNQALRELMGSEGRRKYSKLGNENFLLRQPRLALMHRKQYFEAMFKGEEI